MDSLKVECYAGYRGDQRPLRFTLGDRTYEILKVKDQWYSPGAAFFRVHADDGKVYILRCDEIQDQWSLDGFRALRGVR
jgi:hypothetical protein